VLALHCWGVVDVSRLSDLTQFENHGALLRSLVVNVLSDNGIQEIVVGVELFHHVLVEQNFELFAYLY